MNVQKIKKYGEIRPWGKFEQYVKNKICTVKIITVKPRQVLSLQYHNRRSEFWKVLFGRPTITIGRRVARAKAGDEFFIPTRARHRIAAGSSTVQFLEISFGKFDENDIVRLEDKYGRV